MKCRVVNCSKNAEWFQDDCECACSEDYFFHPKKLICVPMYCPDGLKFNLKELECTKKRGSSVTKSSCRSNEFFDTDTNRCTPKKKCSSSEVYIKATNICMKKKKCRSYQSFDAETNKCMCKKECGKGRKHNKFCRCYLRTADCPKHKRCGEGERWNGAQGKCRCEKFGF